MNLGGVRRIVLCPVLLGFCILGWGQQRNEKKDRHKDSQAMKLGLDEDSLTLWPETGTSSCLLSTAQGKELATLDGMFLFTGSLRLQTSRGSFSC